ncbi:hypothetical protein J1605_011858 [Eschrichtius robustus]|uniref:Uncharacterized protein n=1 Tax=Eschrichtius robustus TaxID=9764 RepID=A0AB34GP85_ESCRO|nr:hypothetical protein J1605_011858 [Eschrichtius robustus]
MSRLRPLVSAPAPVDTLDPSQRRGSPVPRRARALPGRGAGAVSRVPSPGPRGPGGRPRPASSLAPSFPRPWGGGWKGQACCPAKQVSGLCGASRELLGRWGAGAGPAVTPAVLPRAACEPSSARLDAPALPTPSQPQRPPRSGLEPQSRSRLPPGSGQALWGPWVA